MTRTTDATQRPSLGRGLLVVLVSLVAVGVWGGVVYRFAGHFGSSPANQDPVAVVPPSGYAAGPSSTGFLLENETKGSAAGPVRDVFAPPPGLRRASRPAPSHSRSRRPARPAGRTLSSPQSAPVVPPAATRYRLIGIVGHTALLQAGNAAVQPVRVGAEIGDYQVTAVDDDYAILAAEGQPDTLRVSADVRVK